MTLLNLRKRQLALARAKHYVEAEVMRAKAEELERFEVQVCGQLMTRGVRAENGECRVVLIV